ncbi:hypothetical protein KXW99_008227, partial [Aspergillus fumigatus]
MAQWMKDGTGPWSRYSCQVEAGFFKSDNPLASAESRRFHDLLKRSRIRNGQPGDADAAVDSRFRVLGLENLRVVDMSVVPVLLSTLLQVPAYMIVMTCTEVFVEYDLNRSAHPHRFPLWVSYTVITNFT